MKLKLAFLVAASAASFGAFATTTDWGTHDPLEVAAAITPIGVFEDTYLFSLLGAFNTFSTAVSNNLNQVLGIQDGMVTLYQETGVVDAAIGSFAFNDATGNISHAFGTLAGGDYYYLVSGTGTGSLGGFYTISSTIIPVPEPQTLSLLLGGLGVMAFLGLRRRL